MLTRLKLQPQTVGAYDALVAPRSTNLLPEVERKREYIYKKLQPYYDYHGYDV